MAKILLVEDDPMIAEIYIKKFETAGFDVDNAKTGKEVLKYVSTEKYDLVLLDMVLPEMSGMEVLKEIKKSGNYDKNIRVVIFSNLSKIDIQHEAVENGADGIIGKNEFNPSDLVVEVKRLIAQFNEQEKNRKRLGGETEEQKKGKILFIEDEDIFLEMFGKKLRDDGYEVVTADNGGWGLKEALKGEYDLVITDMVMPAMTGEEIVAKIRENESTKNIPIIAISASVTDEKIEEAKNLGVTEFYLKTHIVPSDLSRKVDEILKK